MSDLYASADIQRCRNHGHRFQCTWSDKTPMKVSLLCVTCTEQNHKTTYVAYGSEQGSFGAWRRTTRKDDEEALDKRGAAT